MKGLRLSAVIAAGLLALAPMTVSFCHSAAKGEALNLMVMTGSAYADLVNAFQKAHPDLGAIVLECTNMIPYAADIRRATGLPVFSIYNFVCWFQQSLVPRTFP